MNVKDLNAYNVVILQHSSVLDMATINIVRINVMHHHQKDVKTIDNHN